MTNQEKLEKLAEILHKETKNVINSLNKFDELGYDFSKLVEDAPRISNL